MPMIIPAAIHSTTHLTPALGRTLMTYSTLVEPGAGRRGWGRGAQQGSGTFGRRASSRGKPACPRPPGTII
jgi:hypothetical protein